MTPTQPDRLTDARVQEIIDGCEGVTPGPWLTVKNRETSGYGEPDTLPLLIESDDYALATVIGDVEELDWSANAAHIARLDPATVASAFRELLAFRNAGAEPVSWQWRQARGHIWRAPGFAGNEPLEWYQARPEDYVIRFLYAAPPPDPRDGLIEMAIEALNDLAARIDNDVTASQVGSADEVREIATALIREQRK